MDDMGIPLKIILTEERHRTAFSRLNQFDPKTRNSPLRGKKLEVVNIVINELKNKGCKETTLTELRALRDGIVESAPSLNHGNISIVDKYLGHVRQTLDKNIGDPVSRRSGLEAIAHCCEFAGRWDDAIAALYNISLIEENALKDYVGAARTFIRMAVAYIAKGDENSLNKANNLLLHGLKLLGGSACFHRTKLELLLTLAHVLLRKGQHTECEEILQQECLTLLANLNDQNDEANTPYLVLTANFEVRLGATLKCQGKLQNAKLHLVKGANIRLTIGNWLATAHAVRHLGGYYWWMAEAVSSAEISESIQFLKRSLWFYFVAFMIFHREHDSRQEARTHLNCGKILRLLLDRSGLNSPHKQTKALREFCVDIRTGIEGEEVKLISRLQERFDPQAQVGSFMYIQPFCEAALAHCSRCIEIAEAEDHELAKFMIEAEIEISALRELQQRGFPS